MLKAIRSITVGLLAIALAATPAMSASASTFVPDASNSVLGTWQTGGTVLKYYTGTANELTITMSAPKKQGYSTSMPMGHTSTWGGPTTLTTAYTPNAPVVASNGIGVKYLSTQLTAAERTTAATTPVAFDTVTFSFSRPVEDAVFHINNLGGFNAGSMFSQWKILGGKTMTMLSGQGNFMVDGGTIIKTISTPTVSTTSATGTGSGSVQIPGVYSSVTFELGLRCSSAAACAGTIPEGLAFQWSLPSVYVTPTPPTGVSAADDFASTNPVTAVELDILSNDTLGDGVAPGTLKLCTAGESNGTCSVTSSTTTADGTWVLNSSTNIVTFTPVLGFYGDTTLPYDFKDPNNNLATAIMHVTVNAPPAISAIDDNAATGPITPVELDVLSNDTTGLGVAPGSLKLCAGIETGTGCSITTSTTTPDGTWAVNQGTGIVTFTPVSGFVGVTTLPYVFQDDYAQLATAVMSVTVTAGPPAAADDSASTAPETPVTLDILSNDFFGSGLAAGTLRLCATGETASACSVTTSTTTQEGTWVLDTDALTVTFTPVAGFSGVAILPYVFEDTDSNLVSAQISVTVQDPSLSGGDGPSSELPNTGVPVISTLAFGGIALAIGITLVWRRRQA